MPAVHFTNLLIVVAIGLFAPLALGFFPRFRLPAIVLEIVLGIVIGPSGLGWVTPDLPVSILALVGLAFLLFLSGLEIDLQRLRGRILKLTALGFVVSFVIALVVGLGLQAGGFVKSPLFVAIVLVATSLGVIVPVLKDSGNISTSFGQLVIAAASIADFGAIILLSLFFSGNGSTSTAGTLILLGLFGSVVVLVGLAIAAGALVSLIDRDEAMTHPQFRLKLGGGRVRDLHPDLLRHQRPTVRSQRPVREHLDGRPRAAVPVGDLPRAWAAGAGLRAIGGKVAVGHRGRPAGDIAAVHRGGDADRPAARGRHASQRRGARGREIGRA